jgi:integrase
MRTWRAESTPSMREIPRRWLQAKRMHIVSSTFDRYCKMVEVRLVHALVDHMLVDFKRKIVRD